MPPYEKPAPQPGFDKNPIWRFNNLPLIDQTGEHGEAVSLANRFDPERDAHYKAVYNEYSDVKTLADADSGREYRVNKLWAPGAEGHMLVMAPLMTPLEHEGFQKELAAYVIETGFKVTVMEPLGHGGSSNYDKQAFIAAAHGGYGADSISKWKALDSDPEIYQALRKQDKDGNPTDEPSVFVGTSLGFRILKSMAANDPLPAEHKIDAMVGFDSPDMAGRKTSSLKVLASYMVLGGMHTQTYIKNAKKRGDENAGQPILPSKDPAIYALMLTNSVSAGRGQKDHFAGMAKHPEMHTYDYFPTHSEINPRDTAAEFAEGTKLYASRRGYGIMPGESHAMPVEAPDRMAFLVKLGLRHCNISFPEMKVEKASVVV